MASTVAAKSRSTQRRPHGRPQRRPIRSSRRQAPRLAVTTAEYFYDYAGQDPISSYDLSGLVYEASEGGNPVGTVYQREVGGCANGVLDICQQLEHDYGGGSGPDPITRIKNAVVTFTTGARHHVTETTVGTILIVGGVAYTAGGLAIGAGCTVFTEGMGAAECADAGAHVALLGWGMLGTGAGVYTDIYIKGRRERSRR